MKHNQARAERTLAAWERIEAWLRTHAPRTYAALPGPAELSAVEEAEAAVGVLPPELRSLWSVLGGGPGPADHTWNFIDVPTGALGWSSHGSHFTEPGESGETFTEWIEGIADELHGAPVHAGILRAGTVDGCLSWRDIKDTRRIPSGWVPVGPA